MAYFWTFHYICKKYYKYIWPANVIYTSLNEEQRLRRSLPKHKFGLALVLTAVIFTLASIDLYYNNLKTNSYEKITFILPLANGYRPKC